MNKYLKKIHVWPGLFRQLVVVLICATIVSLVYWFDIAELRQQFILSKQQEQRLMQQSKTLVYRQMLLEELFAQFSEVKKVLNEWQDKLIKYKDINKLLIEIKAVGKANKLHFRVFNAGQGVKENDYLKQPFNIVVTGDYLQTAKFIKQIAKLPWIVVVGDFTVSRSLQRDAGQPLSTDLELDVYYLEKLGTRHFSSSDSTEKIIGNEGV